MRPTKLLIFLAALSPLALAACAPGPNLRFTDTVEAGYIEQDVFVEKETNSDRVYRMSPDELEIYKGSKVYGSARPVIHAPFNPEADGPYRKGKSFDWTMGDWLAAAGEATYLCQEEKATIAATFRNLVPFGTYTIWYGFVSREHIGCPDCRYSRIDVPLGNPDGSQAIFKTDAVGGAVYDLAFEPCLEQSGDLLVATLGIVYHSDGKTHGRSPGAFGRDSHLHVFTTLPNN